MAPAQGWHAKSWSVPHFCIRTKTFSSSEEIFLYFLFDGKRYSNKYLWARSYYWVSAAGVVVSCKIPILASRVRFPGGALFLILQEQLNFIKRKLPDGELNPGLLRDRQGSLPLDYQGLDDFQHTRSSNYQKQCHWCYICGKEIWNSIAS